VNSLNTIFKTVARDLSLTDRTKQQLEELIVSQKLQPGERLPAEGEMGKMLGVSRTVVREAIRSLEARGLVESRTGSGIYVKPLDHEIVQEPIGLLLRSHNLSVEDILEVREMLDVRISALAAERAQPEDIEAMEESIQVLSRLKLSAAEYAETDMAFHSRLAAAARNPLFLILTNSIGEVMLQVRLRVFSVDSSWAIERAVVHHSKILSCIKAHDPAGACREMEEDLNNSRDMLRRAAQSLRGSFPVRLRSGG
jgi:GntR family transcriptional repressor for pyruvate dehydrogenase complex